MNVAILHGWRQEGMAQLSNGVKIAFSFRSLRNSYPLGCKRRLKNGGIYQRPILALVNRPNKLKPMKLIAIVGISWAPA